MEHVEAQTGISVQYSRVFLHRERKSAGKRAGGEGKLRDREKESEREREGEFCVDNAETQWRTQRSMNRHESVTFVMLSDHAKRH